jgi:hypothetical protein
MWLFAEADLQPSFVQSSRKRPECRKSVLAPGTSGTELRRAADVFEQPEIRAKMGTALFSWFKPNEQRAMIREDRKHLEVRARRLLKGYLSADAPRKQRYYEVIAGAAAACEPAISDPTLENVQLTQIAAEAALNVVKQREHQGIADKDQVAALITDAYATVAIANRRASAAYTIDDEMQQLGTAAVHLVTIATSYMSAQPTDEQK